jgi:starch synthase
MTDLWMDTRQVTKGAVMRILFLAAENGALEGGKVGGIGDVVAQLPPALARRGCRVVVVTPSHGFLHRATGAQRIDVCRYRFHGISHAADLYQVPGRSETPGVRHVVVDHPLLTAPDPVDGRPRIYVHDGPDRPFHTDASRFAHFCTAAVAAMARGSLGPLEVMHLHDWHAAPAALLQRFSTDSAGIGGMRTVFSIHNLGLQGIRPLRDGDSSLESWFPGLGYDWLSVSDPRWHDCVNLMAAGIRLADAVHTVSPTYAEEILRPSVPPAFYGGEGLEGVLAYVHGQGRLTGILNGCDYPEKIPGAGMDWPALANRCRARVLRWATAVTRHSRAHHLALERLDDAVRKPGPPLLLTSIGRAVEQKVLLMCAPGADGRPGLDKVLTDLGDRGRLMLLAAGAPEWEARLLEIAARHENCIFLNGHSEACAEALYAAGDLFLMPSSYEPCGISQMLAMRAGQPCVVHAVGGLRDTVRDGIDGFSFSGATATAQVDAFTAAVRQALALRCERPDRWREIRRRAAAARFSWDDAAGRYIEALYT